MSLHFKYEQKFCKKNLNKKTMFGCGKIFYARRTCPRKRKLDKEKSEIISNGRDRHLLLIYRNLLTHLWDEVFPCTISYELTDGWTEE